MPSASMVKIVEDDSSKIPKMNIVIRARMVVNCSTKAQSHVPSWPEQDKMCIQVARWVDQENPAMLQTMKLPPIVEEKTSKVYFTLDPVFQN